MVDYMTDVNTIGKAASTTTLREFAHQSFKRSSTDGKEQFADRVEISEVAAFLSQLAELPEARARKIVDIRNAIQNGSYDVESKLDPAVDKLFAEL